MLTFFKKKQEEGGAASKSQKTGMTKSQEEEKDVQEKKLAITDAAHCYCNINFTGDMER